MKAILIDPFEESVEEVTYNGDFHQIYKLIDADAFDVARINIHGDGVFVDDEGLIKEGPTEFFVIVGYPQPLAGKGLLLGSDAEGETKDPHVTLEWVRNNVSFVFPIRVNGEIVWMPKI